MEFLNYCPLEDEKFQLVHWVMGFSFAQASTGKGYYSICAILMGLVKDSCQTRTTGISVKLEQFGEICICKNRCHGTEFLQVIKGLLIPTVPLDGSLFLACIFTWGQLIKGSCYLCEFRDKSVVISCESQETLTSVMFVGVGQFLIASIFPSSVAIPWAEITCPR